MPSSSILKTTAITLAATLALSAAMPVASANAGHYKHKGELVAIGIIGLALGAIIADSSHRRRQRVDQMYYEIPAYVPPQPITTYPEPYYQPYPDEYDNSYRDERISYRRQMVLTRQRSARDNRQLYQRAPAMGQGPTVITYEQAMSNAGPDAGAPEPWTAGWYSYCRSKFRSFDSKSGTYLGFDGKHHFCVAN